MAPIEVSPDNEQQLRDTVYNYKRLVPTSSSLLSSAEIDDGRRRKKLQRRKAKYRVGSYVRLSRYRTTFDKSYTPNWTTEIFQIRKVQYNTDPITYLLRDYQNREIEGSVYDEELQLAKNKDVYLVEKVLRKQKGRAYVKWLGFDSSHNSWISEKDVF